MVSRCHHAVAKLVCNKTTIGTGARRVARRLDTPRSRSGSLWSEPETDSSSLGKREWIYHLGIKNTNSKYDKASVGIEIANEVDLQLDGDKLYAFGKITPNTEYIGKHFVQKWRGGEYWGES